MISLHRRTGIIDHTEPIAYLSVITSVLSAAVAVTHKMVHLLGAPTSWPHLCCLFLYYVFDSLSRSIAYASKFWEPFWSVCCLEQLDVFRGGVALEGASFHY